MSNKPIRKHQKDRSGSPIPEPCPAELEAGVSHHIDGGQPEECPTMGSMGVHDFDNGECVTCGVAEPEEEEGIVPDPPSHIPAARPESEVGDAGLSRETVALSPDDVGEMPDDFIGAE